MHGFHHQDPPVPFGTRLFELCMDSGRLRRLNRVVLVIAAAGWVLGTTAQSLDSQGPGLSDIGKHLCAESGQTFGHLDGKLYITGGWELWSRQGPFPNYTGPSKFMRTIDTTKSFSLHTDISKYAPATALPKTVPSVQGSVWWPVEEGSLDYMLGWPRVSAVEPYPVPFPLSERYRFTPSSSEPSEDGKWKKVVEGVKQQDFLPEIKTRNLQIGSRGSVWIPRQKKGFVVGGDIWQAGEVNKWLSYNQGMLVYSKDLGMWWNETIPHGRMRSIPIVHLPVGDTDDLIIAVGGDMFTPDNLGGEFQLLDMRVIYIYSTSKRKWYGHKIPSSSPAPPFRGAYCATIISAQDNSSHQLIIMGGVSTDDVNYTRESIKMDTSVWALNIPSMQWVELPTSVGVASNRLLDPKNRATPSCTTISDNYILMSGGRNVIGPWYSPTCDKGSNNIFLFNANTLVWEAEYKPNQKYEVPQLILDVIGGSPDGGAKVISPPDGGFTDPELESILKFPKITIQSTKKKDGSSGSGETSSIPMADRSPPPSSSSGNSNTVAIIASSTVGGVGAIVIIIVVVIVLRKRKREKAQHNHNNGPESGVPQIDGVQRPRPELSAYGESAWLKDTRGLDHLIPSGTGKCYEMPTTGQVGDSRAVEVPGYRLEPVEAGGRGQYI
ncbi:hypothetical protein EX30DRAFT_391949 [Ascodesmis nigricans]|uniref:Galactose oxidase n=1 Tax=Ascodesmis nigricans TaxID=341454 RepID=A0A4S2N5J7_9PEZI|nr:hypothetical protein EX30DRAFT_391949 [Ascodesmis nigricans]